MSVLSGLIRILRAILPEIRKREVEQQMKQILMIATGGTIASKEGGDGLTLP